MNAIIEMPKAAHLIENMSDEAYHASPEFSSSQLKDMNRSAAHFYVNNVSKEAQKETTNAMSFGTLVHTMFLEPEQFEKEFVIAPKFDRRTKAGKEEAAAWEEANTGKMLVTDEDNEAAKHREDLFLLEQWRAGIRQSDPRANVRTIPGQPTDELINTLNFFLPEPPQLSIPSGHVFIEDVPTILNIFDT